MVRPIYLLSPLPKKDTVSLPMISFSLSAERIDFSQCDTLMFTSKQAVVSAEQIDPAWKRYPAIAIGPATKRQIEALGGRVAYHPASFYGESLSGEIAASFKEKRILYLRTETISFDSKAFLEKEGIVLEEQIIYETSCIRYNQEDAPSKGAIIVFTSPSTIHCFLENFEWDESYHAVVIGESTKEHLIPEMQYSVADRPLIDACIEKAKTLQAAAENSK